mmetsp:Transcript_15228/g.36093  ORF Transcript_15228/g.36093 Transcript_15228/m.36093 type:complete len:89 (-) Transcript_15228:16-282(-)
MHALVPLNMFMVMQLCCLRSVQCPNSGSGIVKMPIIRMGKDSSWRGPDTQQDKQLSAREHCLYQQCMMQRTPHRFPPAPLSSQPSSTK